MQQTISSPLESRRVLLLPSMVVALITLSLAIDAFAQCSLNRTTTDTSSTDYVSMLAATTQNDCGNRELWVEAWTPGSPIVISTRGKEGKYEFTSPEDGVLFDIDADGIPDQVSWTLPNSDIAFLALDRNSDGVINNGSELFGNHTRTDARNGYQALSLTAMQSNGGVLRGEVSSDDPLYARLLLWTDSNHNGISEKWELRPASEVVAEIGVSYKPTNTKDEFGNLFAYEGWALVRTGKGRNGAKSGKENLDRAMRTWDVYLKIAQ